MPTEQFGESQIFERRFTRAEMIRIVIESTRLALDGGYDFDYERPIVIQDGDELILRYFQRTVTREARSRQVDMPSLKSLIEKKAEEQRRREENNKRASEGLKEK